ncbi:hypothetical protein NM688_g1338 [Phlebia brevispora]|uniref:Uncharacterized protein n=1 Tax=Phlebia brevispora TaxID=194682 RepID=A0ACC1TCF0_9APHY|nr:hypothetical protein NM688_g1338 [Phlebia brevispora]
MQHNLPSLLFFVLSLSFPANSVLINVTVDDNGPDPLTGLSITYAPNGEWSFGPNCTTCDAKPDPTKVLDGTWHDVSFFPTVDANVLQTATLVFNGSAIYVYCVIAPSSSALDGNADMLFSIDGQTVGSFIANTTGQNGYEYNVPVYTNTSIPPGLHTFTLQNGRTNGEASLVLLDYMVYSNNGNLTPIVVESSSSTSPSSSLSSSSSTSLSSLSSSSSSSTVSPSTAAVSFQASPSQKRTTIIAVICSIGGAIVLLVAALLIYRRRRSQHPSVDGRMYPYGLPPDRDIGEDPASSGWVDGTWDPSATSLDAPRPPLLRSLSHRPPLVLQGQVVPGGGNKGAIGQRSTSSVASRQREESVAAWSNSHVPNGIAVPLATRELSTSAVEVGSLSSMRHPYATSASASVTVEDDDNDVGVSYSKERREHSQDGPPPLPTRTSGGESTDATISISVAGTGCTNKTTKQHANSPYERYPRQQERASNTAHNGMKSRALFWSLVAGGLVNVTVDDSFPDPFTGETLAYSPSTHWCNQTSCAGSHSKPNSAQAYNHTWHGAMYHPTSASEDEIQTASFQFNGSAIYAFGILSLSSNKPADLTFYIDNHLAGSFEFFPPGNNGYNYSVLLYANSSIPQGTHTFTVQNGHSGGNTSLVLLDYLVYTSDDGTSNGGGDDGGKRRRDNDDNNKGGSKGGSGGGSSNSTGNGGGGNSGSSDGNGADSDGSGGGGGQSSGDHSPGHHSHSSNSNIHTIIIAVAVSLAVVLVIVVLLLLYLCRRHIFKRRPVREKDNFTEIVEISAPQVEDVEPYTYRLDTGPRVIPDAKRRGQLGRYLPSPTSEPGQTDSTGALPEPIPRPRPSRPIPGARVVYPWRPPSYEASTSRQ